MGKRMISRCILAAWIAVWVLFLVRPYFKKGLLGEYSHLIKLSAEEKRAYVTGRDLYDFIRFCRESIGAPSTYKVVGLEKDSIEHRRFIYYMYPSIEDDDPAYILDAGKYILRKT
jgi:hypothetical protein